MDIRYNKLWKLLIDLGLTRTELRQRADISTVSLAKLGKGQRVTTTTLNKICQALNCNTCDIADFSKENSQMVREQKVRYSVTPRAEAARSAENIVELFHDRHYISHSYLRGHLKSFVEGRISTRTLNNNLLLWKKDGVIFPAGQGWYSDLQDELQLDTSSLSSLIDCIGSAYPLLNFLCWSTQQLLPFFHHLPGKFFTFIYTDKTALNDLSLALQETYSKATVRIKPTYTSDDFIIRDRNFILLPLHKMNESNTFNGLMPIEHVLVEFAQQALRLSFADESEVRHVITDLTSRYRINMAKLISLASRRHFTGLFKIIQR